MSFPGGSALKNLPANAGDAGSIPESGRSPGEEMATHSSILAWEVPWTGGFGRLSPWSHKESDSTEATELACSLLGKPVASG